jgi:hypothetical protein
MNVPISYTPLFMGSLVSHLVLNPSLTYTVYLTFKTGLDIGYLLSEGVTTALTCDTVCING